MSYPLNEHDDYSVRLTKKGKRWMKFCEKNKMDAGACVETTSPEMIAFEKAERKRTLNPAKLKVKKKKVKPQVGFHHPTPL